MKRIMMAAVALICMTISLVFFSACHSEKTTTTEVVTYSVDPAVSSSDITEKLVALSITNYYGDVIKPIVVAANGADVSNKIIEACDKVYESHSKYTTLTGTVTITKTVGDGKPITLKVYKYPYSK